MKKELKSDTYTSKFIFDITDEQRKRVDKYLYTHGIRKAIFSRLLDEVCDLVEEYGQIVIGALMSPKVNPSDIVIPLSKAKRIGKMDKNG